MPQQNHNSLPFTIVLHISCAIHMNFLCIQGTISSNQIRFLSNISSNQARLRSTKHNNTQNLSTHIVTHILLWISLTSAQSHLLIASSMLPSLTGVLRNKLKFCGTVPTLIQEKFIQVWCDSTKVEVQINFLCVSICQSVCQYIMVNTDYDWALEVPNQNRFFYCVPEARA